MANLPKLVRLLTLHSWNRESDGDFTVSFIAEDGQGRSIRLSDEAAKALSAILPNPLERSETRTLSTVRVLASSAVTAVDGSVALILNTAELGPIAFAVDQQAIAALRRDLAECELALSRKHGTA